MACANVPKFSMVVGGSFGAGNYGMCGRAFSPRLMWMWPNARISVMGGEQAAGVLAQVKRSSLEARGKGDSWSQEEEAAFRADHEDKYEREGHPLYASARLWDDGVIRPEDSRCAYICCHAGVAGGVARNVRVAPEVHAVAHHYGHHLPTTRTTSPSFSSRAV